MITKYGYYVANTKQLYGDMEYANEAKEIYESFGIPTKHTGHQDGVSIFLKDDGSLTKRATAAHFFDATVDL